MDKISNSLQLHEILYSAVSYGCFGGELLTKGFYHDAVRVGGGYFDFHKVVLINENWYNNNSISNLWLEIATSLCSSQ